MFVPYISILSCSAGVSTEYRVQSAVTSMQEYQSQCSNQTNSGVCPWWGDNTGGNSGYLYANILGTTLFYPFLPPASSLLISPDILIF